MIFPFQTMLIIEPEVRMHHLTGGGIRNFCQNMESVRIPNYIRTYAHE